MSAVALALGVYVAGYRALPERSTFDGALDREFKSRPIGMAYVPLGWLECQIRQREICLGMPGPDEYSGTLIIFEP
jgi:hypothetical protein